MPRILITDDDSAIRQMLRTLFEADGFLVAEAPNGKKALDMLRAEHYDLVIIDVFMPEKDGIETIAEIRRDFYSTRIIAISGGCNAMSLDLLPVAKTLGAVETIMKPFNPERLSGIVHRLLNGDPQ